MLGDSGVGCLANRVGRLGGSGAKHWMNRKRSARQLGREVFGSSGARCLAGYELVGESSADGPAARAEARAGLISLLVAAAREQPLGKGARALSET